VHTGETVTCTCHATDDTEGASSIALLYTASPDTSQTGTHEEYCTATDKAGNSANSPIVTYTVSTAGTGPGSGGGGGATTTWLTFAVPEADFTSSAGYTRAMGANERLNASINGIAHYVNIISVNATSAKISVTSTPQEATLNIGDTKKFDVDGDNVYDLIVTLNSITGSRASITTKAISEALTAEEIAAVEAAAGAGTPAPEATASNMKWIIGAIVLVIVVIGIIALTRKKRKY
jgi:hypothetical protein